MCGPSKVVQGRMTHKHIGESACCSSWRGHRQSLNLPQGVVTAEVLCRNAARESFQAVKQQEDRGCGSVKGPASEYLHAVMPSYYQSGGGNKAAPLRAAEAALKANNYTCLTSSESMR